jgi:HD-GYP domain-containing protein (c-di-GMP phosphodiesterase class II)
MSTSKTHTLPIQDLKPGMMLCAIVQQSGRLEVKSKGKVSHQSVIEQLIAAGVYSVLIETSEPIIATKAKPPVKTTKPAVKKPLVSAAPKATPEKVEPVVEPKVAQDIEDLSDFGDMIDLSGDADEVFDSPMVYSSTDFSEEAEVAEQLIISCKKLHKKTEDKIERDIALDLTGAQTLVDDVQQSLIRNPNSLLCLSMIRNEGEYVSNHSMHVSILLCHFARYLEMSEKDCQRMALLGYFFDIGMLKVPKEILYKQGRPTEEEQKLIQAHVQHSLSLLAPLELGNSIMLAIEQHHERLDGSGYPKGLKGEDIHIYSRMLAIVDCYEAMTTNRPFQKKCSPATALKIISNKQYGYDQKLALKFIRCVGVYPVGSLVILSNQRIAIVIKNNDDSALKPVVMAFYSITHNKYIEQDEIDLSAKSNTLTIEQPTLPEHYRLDLSKLSF